MHAVYGEAVRKLDVRYKNIDIALNTMFGLTLSRSNSIACQHTHFKNIRCTVYCMHCKRAKLSLIEYHSIHGPCRNEIAGHSALLCELVADHSPAVVVVDVWGSAEARNRS